jgi:hypothetical protein
MIEEGLVADLHRIEVLARGIIADAVPLGGAVADEVVPGEGLGFRFHQPFGHARLAP